MRVASETSFYLIKKVVCILKTNVYVTQVNHISIKIIKYLSILYFLFDVVNQEILLRTYYVQKTVIDRHDPLSKRSLYILGTQRHMNMSQYCDISDRYILDPYLCPYSSLLAIF